MKINLAEKIKGLPKKSLTYILVGGGGLLLFYILVIAHYHGTVASYDLETKEIRGKIEAQKILLPFYNELLKKMEIEKSEHLPVPEETDFNIDQIDEINAIFDKAARKSNLQTIHFAPDPKSIPKDFSTLMVDAYLAGNFLDFRQFLEELGAVPYLKHIEEIQIKSMDGQKEFRLKLWLTLNKNI